jgi:hypothetical protein
MRDFKSRQSKQFVAIGVALFLLLLSTLLYTRADIFGAISKNSILVSQVIVIAAFVGFSGLNWRCPSCGKYLGSDITRRSCKQCGVRFG